MPHIFSNTTPQFGRLRPLPKAYLKRGKTATPDEQSYGLDTQRENHAKICLISDDLGLRSPVICRKTFQTKTATSIVARVLLIKSSGYHSSVAKNIDSYGDSTVLFIVGSHSLVWVADIAPETMSYRKKKTVHV